MLNEEKIILMTKLAIYEKGEGKKEIPMSRYYRNDYVGVHMLYTFLAVTAGYVLLFALYVARDVEDFLSSLTTMDLKKFLFTALAIYVAAELLLLLVTWLLYRYRFKQNRQHLNEYNKNLKKLKKLQKKEQAAARKIVEGKEAQSGIRPEESPDEETASSEDEEEDIFREPERQGYFRGQKSRGTPGAADGEDDPDTDDDLDWAGPDLTDDEDADDGLDWAEADETGDEEADDDLDWAESDEDAEADLTAGEEADDGLDWAEANEDREPELTGDEEKINRPDPDQLLEQELKNLVLNDPDDDEEDEDGFTFSS